MKIAVFSDSHGELELMNSAVAGYRPDMVIHLGDFSGDAHELKRKYPRIPFTIVRGNCDPVSTDNITEFLSLGGSRVLITHGHMSQVRIDLLAIEYTARSAGADVALFGHTHEAIHTVNKGITLFNPGAVSSYEKTSWGQIEISDNKLTFNITEI